MNLPNRDEETGPAQNANQPLNIQPRQRSSVPSFLFLSFLLFMLTSHNGDEFLARHQHQDALKELSWQLTNYTAWMNGTESNFTISDRDQGLGPLLDSLSVQGQQLDPLHSSYFPNITGFIHGNSRFFNLSSATLDDSLPWKSLAQNYITGINTTAASEMWGNWNWNTSSRAELSLVEKKPLGIDEKTLPTSDLALVHGRIALTDSVTSEDLRFEFEGVHFISNGSIYGFAEPSGRRIDIRLLPSLVPDESRNETAAIVGPELQARINKLKNLIDAGVLDQDSASEDRPKTACPFTFFAHINSVPVPEHLMKELEEEMQNPTGISTITPPKLSITGVLLSKECGILYTLHDTEGLRSRTFFRKLTTYAGLSALGYLTILILFSRQLERSRNPSGISRVSRWTYLSQATMDSVSFAGHVTFAILAEGRPSVSLIAPAFLACVLFVQEAQFFALVNQIQGSETFVPTPPPAAARRADGTLVRASTSDEPAVGTFPQGAGRTLSSPTPAPPPFQPVSSLSFSSSPTPTNAFPSTPGRTLNGSPLPSTGSSAFSNLVQVIPNAPSAPTYPPQATRPIQAETRPTATPTANPTTTPDPTPVMGFLSFFVHYIRTDSQAQLWIGLFIFLAVIVQVILSPVLSVLFVSTTYSFIWLPQIIRSATRNRTSGLGREYIVGVTVCRLATALYFLSCPRNVLEVDPRPWAPLLALFVVFQAIVVMLQDTLGPSFFLPERFKVSQGYDYHPPMPLPDSESPEQSLGDCAICMDAILVDPSLRPPSKPQSATSGASASEKGALQGAVGGGLQRTRGGILNAVHGVNNSKARKTYSLAPCHHLFHTECLEKWLAIKNICPQCRRPLPPL